MNTVDSYLKKLNPEDKKQLERIRQTVLKIVPNAEEVISYGMPGIKINGSYLCGYAAFKDHLSFFPTAEPVEVLSEKLKKYKTSKGTIQFTQENPLPESLIKQLIKIRLNAIK